MGYPMTYRRVVNRNGLAQGDYAREQAKAYSEFRVGSPLCGFESVEALERAYADRVAQASARSLLLGDLRRLERDALDEDAIVKHIVQVTGIDADSVVLVLKEFMSW